MTEYWQRTTISGTDEDRSGIREVVMHRRGEDPLVMAFRRNRELAGCSRIRMETEELFLMEMAEDGRRTAMEIPRDERKEEEWDW